MASFETTVKIKNKSDEPEETTTYEEYIDMIKTDHEKLFKKALWLVDRVKELEKRVSCAIELINDGYQGTAVEVLKGECQPVVKKCPHKNTHHISPMNVRFRVCDDCGEQWPA